MKFLLKISILLFLASGATGLLQGQVIDNKVNIYTSLGIVENFGEETIAENGFVMPSLYNNYKSNNFVLLRGTYKYRKFLSVGIELKKIQYDKWDDGNETLLFEKASSNLFSVAPVIKFHNGFAPQSMFNRFTLSASIAPSVNFVNVRLDTDAFIDVHSISTEPESTIKSQIVSLGTSIYIGAEYAITQDIGIFFEVGGHCIGVEGKLYNDKTLCAVSGSAGLVFKLFKNKRYYL